MNVERYKIPGSGGYSVTVDGAFFNPKGREIALNTDNVYIKGKYYRKSTLVWTVFKGDIPDGYYIYRKSGAPNDWSLSNFELLPKSEVFSLNQKRNGRSIRLYQGKTLVKEYRNAKAMAEATHYHPQSIRNVIWRGSLFEGKYKLRYGGD